MWINIHITDVLPSHISALGFKNFTIQTNRFTRHHHLLHFVTLIATAFFLELFVIPTDVIELPSLELFYAIKLNLVN